MTTTDTAVPIPARVAELAGVELAERVRAAVPAAVALYRRVEAFAASEHGQAIRAYWAAQDGATGGDAFTEFLDFDQATLVLMGLSGPLSSIDEFISEAVGDKLTERSQQELARILNAHDGVDEVAELTADVAQLAARVDSLAASVQQVSSGMGGVA